MNKTAIKFVVGGLAIVGVAIVLFSSLSSENLTYYHTPNEILANPGKFSSKKIRVMGLIQKGSVTWDPANTRLGFKITEDSETFMEIGYTGSKPDMFKEGQGVVVEGKMGQNGVFEANTLLVKHSEEYKVDKNAHVEKKTKYLQSVK